MKNYPKIKCSYCDRYISNNNYERHIRGHKAHPEAHEALIRRESLDHDGLNCKYCNKLLKNRNALIQHEVRCISNPNRKESRGLAGSHNPMFGKQAWNKGLTKETDSRVAKYSQKVREFYETPEGLLLKKKFSDIYTDNETFKKCGHVGGLLSASSQSKRSKNEIYFCELCEGYFNSVKHNEPIFNGWDADIIIEDIKYAVLWNGPWHYKKLRQSHSLEQVQARDKIKLDQILLCGYTPYIIKDMGSESKKFVEEQFKEFIKTLDLDKS